MLYRHFLFCFLPCLFSSNTFLFFLILLLLLLNLRQSLSFGNRLIQIQCLFINFQCFKTEFRKTADCSNFCSDLKKDILHLFFNLAKRYRCIQPFRIHDSFQYNKILKADSFEKLLNVFLLLLPSLFFDFFQLSINQSDRLINQTCDFFHLTFKTLIRLQAQFFDPLAFILDCRLCFIQLRTVLLHILDCIFCIGDIFIFLHPGCHPCLYLFIIPLDLRKKSCFF